MSRVIKFRAWDKENRRMIGPIFLGSSDQGALPVNEDWDDVFNLDDCEEIMQFTGLKDMFGVEIYEGDIIEWNSEGRSDFFSIEWNNTGASWKIGGLYPIDIEENGKVIGNIYERPGFLKDQSEK